MLTYSPRVSAVRVDVLYVVDIDDFVHVVDVDVGFGCCRCCCCRFVMLLSLSLGCC